MRVHVEPSQYEFFACLPIIQQSLTTDPTRTRLHACRSPSSNYTEPCSIFRNCEQPIRIFLSIMWFTEQIAASELLVEYHEYHSNFDQRLSRRCLGFEDYVNESSESYYPDKYLGYRLCYSLHSSFSEIVDVLQTLKPKRVTPIAAPLESLLTTKRLFQIIDFFIEGKKFQPIERLMTKLEKKSLNYQIQLKHRYESFETRIERKRRRKLFKEQQQQKANGEELDLGMNDQRDDDLLQRIDSLIQSTLPQSKQLIPSTSRFDILPMDLPVEQDSSDMNISMEETIPSESSPSSESISNQLSLEDSTSSEQVDASPMEDLLPNDSTLEIVSINPDLSSCTDNLTTSDTVDYEFDTPIETTSILKTM